MVLRSISILGLSLIGATGWAGIIGTNPPALPLTAERIGALPRDNQGAWKAYLERSERRMREDQSFFEKELRGHHVVRSISPPEGRAARGIALNQPAEWYVEPEALRIADILISFQTPAGGWSKNIDMTQHPRVPGERFSADNVSRYPTVTDNDAPRDRSWNYVGTFDNDATVTQLRYLAKVISARHENGDKQYRAAFFRGMDYIFNAQYPNGGWPQVWPLQGGYHDAITYNDDAMIQVLGLLREVAKGTNEFRFVPTKLRTRAEEGLKHGIECILGTQIVARGQRTVWCQQHDALTLEPCSARNYEMPCESSAESAGIMLFLMREPKPSKQIIAAVNAAAAWFEERKIRGFAYRLVADAGRMLVEAPDSGPIWARYYDIATGRPIFGERDKTIHDNVNEISRERRNGYAWYRDTPQKALERYEEWRKNFSGSH